MVKEYNYPVHKPITLCVGQSACHLTCQRKSVNQPFLNSANQWASRQTINPVISWLGSRSASHPVSQSVSQAVGRSVGRSVGQISQLVCRRVSHLVGGLPVGRSVSQKAERQSGDKSWSKYVIHFNSVNVNLCHLPDTLFWHKFLKSIWYHDILSTQADLHNQTTTRKVRRH